MSRYILDQVLSGESTETVVENIHDYLTKLSEEVRNGKIKTNDYIIYKVFNILYLLFLHQCNPIAPWKKSGRLSRCQKPAPRPGCPTHETERRVCKARRCHSVYILLERR